MMVAGTGDWDWDARRRTMISSFSFRSCPVEFPCLVGQKYFLSFRRLPNTSSTVFILTIFPRPLLNK